MISADLVKKVLLHFAQHEALTRVEYQNQRIRAICGREVHIDRQEIGIALARDDDANKQHETCVWTVTVEHGFKIFAGVAPKRETFAATSLLYGINDICLPTCIHSPALSQMRSEAAVGGPLGQSLVAIRTDCQSDEKHTLLQHLENIFRAKLSRGDDIHSPWGVLYLLDNTYDSHDS